MENQNQQTQSAPSPIQTPSPINNSSKSKVIPIILGVAAAIVIAIGAYVLGTKQSQQVVQNIAQTTPIPSPIPTIDETANWKTYADRELGFEFKYPDKFGNIKNDESIYHFSTNDDFLIYFSSEPKKQQNPIHADEDCGTLKNSFLYCRYLNSKTGWIFIKGGCDFIDCSFSLIGQPNALPGHTNKVASETGHPSNNSTFINFNLQFSEIAKIPYEEQNLKLKDVTFPDSKEIRMLGLKIVKV